MPKKGITLGSLYFSIAGDIKAEKPTLSDAMERNKRRVHLMFSLTRDAESDGIPRSEILTFLMSSESIF